MLLLSRYVGAVSRERDPLSSPSNRVQAWAPEGLQQVVTIIIEAGQLDQALKAARSAPSLEENDDIDGLDDQFPRHCQHSLLYELLEPIKPSLRRIGVNGG